MLSSRILLFDNASLDALLMLYICIYMNYVCGSQTMHAPCGAKSVSVFFFKHDVVCNA